MLKIDAELGDSPKELLHALGDVVALIEPRLLELWKSADMTFSQRRILARLRQRALSAGMLAAELGVVAPTLTRQLAKLEAQGLITREIDSGDRRRVLVALTNAGRRALASHRVFGDSVVATAVRDLTTVQRRELVAGLAQLVLLARQHQETAVE